mmetsp:Transcript_28409/g.61741  ORF Transcript_28409/g.61741 Transcript_28409/m.61741 type:complete len:274 (+) Transcript_28409:640-1461(+)
MCIHPSWQSTPFTRSPHFVRSSMTSSKSLLFLWTRPSDCALSFELSVTKISSSLAVDSLLASRMSVTRRRTVTLLKDIGRYSFREGSKTHPSPQSTPLMRSPHVVLASQTSSNFFDFRCTKPFDEAFSLVLSTKNHSSWKFGSGAPTPSDQTSSSPPSPPEVSSSRNEGIDGFFVKCFRLGEGRVSLPNTGSMSERSRTASGGVELLSPEPLWLRPTPAPAEAPCRTACAISDMEWPAASTVAMALAFAFDLDLDLAFPFALAFPVAGAGRVS